MPLWDDHYETARLRVARGRSIVQRQAEFIERQKRLGADTEESAELLRRFQRSQAIFEEALDRISRERTSQRRDAAALWAQLANR